VVRIHSCPFPYGDASLRAESLPYRRDFLAPRLGALDFEPLLFDLEAGAAFALELFLPLLAAAVFFATGRFAPEVFDFADGFFDDDLAGLRDAVLPADFFTAETVFFTLFAAFFTAFFAAGSDAFLLAAAFPSTAPTTPPTTAPMGPATLPSTAPVAAPAACLEMGGISRFSEVVDFASVDLFWSAILEVRFLIRCSRFYFRAAREICASKKSA
jgi:hypothetical protein